MKMMKVGMLIFAALFCCTAFSQNTLYLELQDDGGAFDRANNTVHVEMLAPGETVTILLKVQGLNSVLAGLEVGVRYPAFTQGFDFGGAQPFQIGESWNVAETAIELPQDGGNFSDRTVDEVAGSAFFGIIESVRENWINPAARGGDLVLAKFILTPNESGNCISAEEFFELTTNGTLLADENAQSMSVNYGNRFITLSNGDTSRIAGDFDGSGDINATDFSQWIACFFDCGGPGCPISGLPDQEQFQILDLNCDAQPGDTPCDAFGASDATALIQRFFTRSSGPAKNTFGSFELTAGQGQIELTSGAQRGTAATYSLQGAFGDVALTDASISDEAKKQGWAVHFNYAAHRDRFDVVLINMNNNLSNIPAVRVNYNAKGDARVNMIDTEVSAPSADSVNRGSSIRK